jgi:hypothetical protein
LLLRAQHFAANLSRLFTCACHHGLRILGRERPPANSQIAALHFLNHDPSGFTHDLPFDTDYDVGQLFNQLPLLRIRERALKEFVCLRKQSVKKAKMARSLSPLSGVPRRICAVADEERFRSKFD